MLASTTTALAAHVNVIELDNQIISPVTQQYIEDAIKLSETDGAVCLVIKLDTPGGLLESTRGIVKKIMNAKVPIVVYVGPSGSRAGSAGVFITLSAHIAAMAPSTNIGAAHPVMVGEGQQNPIKKLIRRIKSKNEENEDKEDGQEFKEIVEEEQLDPMSEKIINDTVAWITTIAKTRGRNAEWAKKAVTESVSVTETEAVENNIVDLIATDVPDLLAQINGRSVEILGETVELATKDVHIQEIPMTVRQQFLAVITNPNVAYILMMLGTFGLIFEFTHPGVGFPGIAGLICLLLAMFAFQTLPISYVAIALILIGFALLIAEIQIVSYGLLAIGGVISLTLGSLMLIDSPNPNMQISLSVILPTVATLAGFILFAISKLLGARKEKVTTGKQGIVGEHGVASTALRTSGKVFVHGEFWNATCSKSIKRGQKIRVLRVEGLHLFVEPITKGG